MTAEQEDGVEVAHRLKWILVREKPLIVVAVALVAFAFAAGAADLETFGKGAATGFVYGGLIFAWAMHLYHAWREHQ